VSLKTQKRRCGQRIRSAFAVYTQKLINFQFLVNGANLKESPVPVPQSLLPLFFADFPVDNPAAKV
jgi:hypothetical protein